MCGCVRVVDTRHQNKSRQGFKPFKPVAVPALTQSEINTLRPELVGLVALSYDCFFSASSFLFFFIRQSKGMHTCGVH